MDFSCFSRVAAVHEARLRHNGAVERSPQEIRLQFDGCEASCAFGKRRHDAAAARGVGQSDNASGMKLAVGRQMLRLYVHPPTDKARTGFDELQTQQPR